MKKIDFNMLLNELAKEYNNYFDIDYIEGKDMLDILQNANEEYYEDNDMYRCTVEFSKVGKVSFIFEYYAKYIMDDKENIVDTIYYI